MGLLDETIREHLELKRRHGADEAELARQEAEAFGAAPVAAEEESFAWSYPPDADEDEAPFDRADEAGLTGEREAPSFEWHGSASDDLDVPSFVEEGEPTAAEDGGEEAPLESPPTELSPEGGEGIESPGDLPPTFVPPEPLEPAASEPPPSPAPEALPSITDAPTEFFTPVDAEDAPPLAAPGEAPTPEEDARLEDELSARPEALEPELADPPTSFSPMEEQPLYERAADAEDRGEEPLDVPSHAPDPLEVEAVPEEPIAGPDPLAEEAPAAQESWPGEDALADDMVVTGMEPAPAEEELLEAEQEPPPDDEEPPSFPEEHASSPDSPSARGFFEDTAQHEGVRREERPGRDPDFET